jgi:hypothetical protein
MSADSFFFWWEKDPLETLKAIRMGIEEAQREMAADP